MNKEDTNQNTLTQEQGQIKPSIYNMAITRISIFMSIFGSIWAVILIPIFFFSVITTDINTLSIIFGYIVYFFWIFRIGYNHGKKKFIIFWLLSIYVNLTELQYENGLSIIIIWWKVCCFLSVVCLALEIINITTDHRDFKKQ